MNAGDPKVKTVKRSKLQLAGVTCMLLAAKFEEIYAPEARLLRFFSSPFASF